MAGLHANRGAKRARETRADLGLHPSEPLACILTTVEDAGLPVMAYGMPETIAGCLWHRGAARIIHVNAVQALARQRFTLAHELGHVRCGHEAAVLVDKVATIGGSTHDPRELEANAFAAELLVPRSGLEALADGDPTLDELVVTAARYGVSAIMLLYRYVTCGLVSAERCDRLKDEIEEELHLERQRDLGITPLADRLAAIAGPLPYLSPALRDGGLAALLAGSASVRDAAQAAGVREEALAPSVARLAVGG